MKQRQYEKKGGHFYKFMKNVTENFVIQED